MSKRPRTRGASSSAAVRTATHDSYKFRSAAAEKCYEMLITKQYIQERYLKFDASGIRRGPVTFRMGGYIDTAEKLGWNGFATPLEPFSASLVCEFYANLPEAEGDRCWVRGKWVNFSSAAINEHYQLEDRDEEAEDDEHPLIADTRIFDLLTLGRGITEQSDSGTVRMTHFSRDARFWRLFIAHNLHPVSQEDEVRRESYRLLHKIITEKYINAGRIIHHKLSTWRPAARQRLGFPHLIMGLCVAAGVEVPTDTLLIRPVTPFDGTYVHRRIKIHRGMSEMTSREYYALQQRRFEVHPGESDGEQGSLPESPTGSQTEEQQAEQQAEQHVERQSPARRSHHARPQSAPTSDGGDLAQLTSLVQRLVTSQERMEQNMAAEHARLTRAQTHLGRRMERLARHQTEMGQWMYTSMTQLGLDPSMPPVIPPPSPDAED